MVTLAALWNMISRQGRAGEKSRKAETKYCRSSRNEGTPSWSGRVALKTEKGG